MDAIDAIVNSVLREMGCDPNKPPHWIPRIHKTIDQTTGELVREINDGYLCSRCGKYSWARKEKCDGCNSIMPKGE